MIARINLAGANYMDTLLKEISVDCIPRAQGGNLEQFNESYAFDLSPTGPFYTEPSKLVVEVSAPSTCSTPTASSSPSEAISDQL
jgi:hypothetical protein